MDLRNAQRALDRAAALAGVGEGRPRGAAHGAREVGVGQHEHRVLAVERRTERVRPRAHASPTSRPARAEPVKRTWATGAETSAAPVSVWPWTTASRPSGSPARAKTRAIRSPHSGTWGEGLSTTPLPAMSATATSPSGVANGSVGGPRTPTTPSGS